MTGKGKLLFVDDEKRVLNSMRGLFRRDYELFLTTNGAEAIELVAKHDIDVIVADQRMPGLSGVEVLGKVREVSPRTVRILLTGYADPEAIEGSINVGEVFRFLSKPCQPNLLRETVQLAIDAAKVSAQVIRRCAPIAPAPAAPTPTRRQPAAPAAPAPTPPQPAVAAPVVPTPAPPQRPVAAPIAAPPPPKITPLPTIGAQPPITPAPTAQPPATQQPASVAASPANTPHVESAAREPDATESTATTSTNRQLDSPTGTHQAPTVSHWQDRTEIVLSGDSSQEIRQLRLTQEANASIRNVGVAVFTVNPNFAESAIRTISTDRNATLATTLVKVAEVLEQRLAGVLVTDFSSDIRLLQNMIGALKQHLPELVTIVVSENRDASDMINLINYGQVFRYVEKPIDSSALRTDVNAAVLKHLQLLEHPELVQRHQVLNFSGPGDGSTTLNQFIGKVTQMRGRWTSANGKTH